MKTLTNGFIGVAFGDPSVRAARPARVERESHYVTPQQPDVEFLRHVAWEIGEGRPADAYEPADAHVGLAAVTPHECYAHWRIPDAWVEEAARRKGGAWHHCRLVLRLYDVSYIEFTGLNAQIGRASCRERV